MSEDPRSDRSTTDAATDPSEPAGMEHAPLAGEGTDDDEATTTVGPGRGGSAGRPGQGPTAETSQTDGTPTDDR